MELLRKHKIRKQDGIIPKGLVSYIKDDYNGFTVDFGTVCVHTKKSILIRLKSGNIINLASNKEFPDYIVPAFRVKDYCKIAGLNNTDSIGKLRLYADEKNIDNFSYEERYRKKINEFLKNKYVLVYETENVVRYFKNPIDVVNNK